MTRRYTGTSVRRVEDPRLLSGRGRYVDDLHPPGVGHVAFVRSPHAHALIRAIDTTAARRHPGVWLVWSAADLAGRVRPLELPPLAGLRLPSAVPPLAGERVRFVGDPIALVVATSRAVAEDACELVEVDYDPLAPVATIDHALDPERPAVFEETGTNLAYDETFTYGDPDAGFAAAAHVVRRRLTQCRQANLPLEGRAGLAEYDAGTGELVYRAAHQNPHALRVHLGRQLEHPLARLHVRCGDIGGSFGQKAYPTREDVLVAAAARHLGRPVKWVEDRTENLLAAGHARDECLDVAAAVDDRGRVMAMEVAMTLDQGAYPVATLPSAIFPTLVRVLFPASYAIEHLRFRGRVAVTNKASYVAYRGPWQAETFARERLLDAIAQDLGLDPVEVRHLNLVPPGSYPRRMVTGPTQQGIAVEETLREAVRRFDVPGRRARHRAAREHGVHRGVGVAVVVEPAPGPPDYAQALGAGASSRSAQQAVARLEPDGRLSVFTSQNPHGQSHHTTLAQLAADGLGVELDAVSVVSGDTATTPFNLVSTGGSRAATLASGAVLGAVGGLREEVLARASDLLEAAPEDLAIQRGEVYVRGTPASRCSLASLAARFAPVEVSHDYECPPGGWSQATHVCEVEVDPATGLVGITGYLVVGDCGRVINPDVVAGQIRGGVTQGIGSVLFERFVYDDEGQPSTTSLLDYLVPTATDVPRIEVVHLERPEHGEHEYRGVGEGGAIGAPAALCAAIEDALGAFGVRITDQHLPPARLVALIEEHAPGVVRPGVAADRRTRTTT